MHKKLMVVVGLVALGVGAVSTVALQSRAQNVPAQPTTSVTLAPTHENTAADTDNIQNDKNGIEAPDATSTVKQGDTQESGESGSANVNEVEDGN